MRCLMSACSGCLAREGSLLAPQAQCHCLLPVSWVTICTINPAGLAAQKTAGHAEVRRLESTVAQMEAELHQLGLEGQTACLLCRHTGLPCWQWSSPGAAYMSM